MSEENSGGRPPHKPTRPSHEKVAWRIAAGWKHSEIALELGIDDKTLRKHYMIELDTGWIKSRGKVIDMMVKTAKTGNATQQKKLLELIDGANPKYGPDPEEDGTLEEAKTGYVPKKETQLEEAKTAGQGTEWGNDLVRSGLKAN